MTGHSKNANWVSEILETTVSADLPVINPFERPTLESSEKPLPESISAISKAIPENRMSSKKKFSTKICCARISIFADKIPGKVFELSLNNMRLGRASSNDIIIPDPCISARHCVFELTEDGVWVRDLNSANGTFVNGQHISECLLRCGDVIRCGTSILKFEFAIKRPRLASTDFSGLHKNPEKNIGVDMSPQRHSQPEVSLQGPISFEKLAVNHQKTRGHLRLFATAAFSLLAFIILSALLICCWFFPSLVPWLTR